MKKQIYILISLLLSYYSFATIIHVPADQPTIQAGIDVAINGDTILVAPGTYVENINFNGKNVTVASLFLTTHDTAYISQTIIDGDSITSVVCFRNGEDSTAVLDGFTLTNGRGWIDYGSGSPQHYGGGITCDYSSCPGIANTIIYNNYGVAILCDNGSHPALKNVTIKENPGGIFCIVSNIDLLNVTITGNSGYWDRGHFHQRDRYRVPRPEARHRSRTSGGFRPANTDSTWIYRSAAYTRWGCTLPPALRAARRSQ